MKSLKTIFTFACLLVFLNIQAYTEKNLLLNHASQERIKKVIITDQKWVPYPSYTNRQGWDKLLGDSKASLIKEGEKYLTYEWQVVKATDYIEFERSGSRNIMQHPFNSNNNAIVTLLMAELAEGEGRFVDQLINGVYLSCEMTTWALSAHLPAQHSKRSLPDYKEHIIDLTSGGLSALLAWTYYFLKDEFDSINPVIAERLYHELKVRTLDTYMNEDRFWWMAFNYKPGMLVNNWNPWCNFNVLQCFMLLENDKDKLSEAVYRTMKSVDQFINYTHSDGGCEEGPSYWGHAAGKMYDYLQMLSDATGGAVSIFNEPLIRNMGEYISRSYVDNGWVVNFADASAKGGKDAQLIYRYGKAVGSKEMMSFAAYLEEEKPTTFNAEFDIFRTLQTLLYGNELKAYTAPYQTPNHTWYEETQFCYIKNKNFFLASKGGYNNESHNHNDAGTFSLYYNGTPFFIDAGVGTYTRQTFSNERYTIWTMQSNYHNLPMINGKPQKFGSIYRASNVSFSRGSNTFSLDIAGAYGKEANAEKWIRSYTLKEKKLEVKDTFVLKEAEANNLINFLSWGNINISHPGEVEITAEGKTLLLKYDKKVFTPSIETIVLDDPRLSNVWGDKIYRITLTANERQKTGTYTYTITTNN